MTDKGQTFTCNAKYSSLVLLKGKLTVLQLSMFDARFKTSYTNPSHSTATITTLTSPDALEVSVSHLHVCLFRPRGVV